MASQTRSVNNTVSSAWANPDNAFAEDDLCTSTSTDAAYNTYNFINNSFTIPAGTTITGLKALFRWGGDGDDVFRITLKDVLGARVGGEGAASVHGCADASLASIGGDGNLLGGTWTPAHINSASFECQITYKKSAKGATMYIDYIEITVYYAVLAPLVATSEASDPTAYNSQNKPVRTSDGTLYAVYFKQLDGKHQIYVKKSVDGGDTWTDETRISTASGMELYDQYYPSIAVDSNDYLHVVWRGRATGYTTYHQIWYAKYTTSWATPVRISTYAGMDGEYQKPPSIAVDSSSGYLHVVWYGAATGYANPQIWYAKYTAGWATPVRISTYAGMDTRLQEYPSIAVDSNDYLHVVFYGYADGYTTNYQIWYTKYTGSWVTPVRISTYVGMDTNYQDNPDIAIDSNDYLHVVWHGRAAGYTTYRQIWYAKYTTSWATPRRLSSYAGMDVNDQRWPPIAVDSNDYLHVLWHGKATGYTDEEKVWYRKYTTSWQDPVCLHVAGRNRLPNLRWSRYPSSNQVTGRLDYVFTEGTASPYSIRFDYLTLVAAYEETIVAQRFPMRYLSKPVKAQELISTVEGATVTHTAKNFPETLLKKGAAQDLRSKFS